MIDKKEFAKVALDENVKAFVVHVAFFTLKMTIHPAQKAQIALLITKEVTVLEEYLDFADIFLKKSAEILPECKGINEYTIKLQKDKQPLYGPIYSLGPVELETLKTYIMTYLANSFIRPSKSLAQTLTLFVQKPDGSLRLCVNYQGLNNLTIKKQYPLHLIEEFLDWLSLAKHYIQQDLTSASHQMRIKERNEWKTAF